MRPSSATVSSTSALKRAISFAITLLARRARLCLVDHHLVQFARCGAWHPGTPRSSAPARRSRHRARRTGSPVCSPPAATASVTLVILAKRPGHRAEEDERARPRQQNSDDCEDACQPGGLVDGAVDLAVHTRGTMGIERGELTEVFAQRLLHGVVDVGVAPLARGLRAHAGRDVRKLACEILKVRGARREFRELREHRRRASGSANPPPRRRCGR